MVGLGKASFYNGYPDSKEARQMRQALERLAAEYRLEPNEVEAISWALADREIRGQVFNLFFTMDDSDLDIDDYRGEIKSLIAPVEAIDEEVFFRLTMFGINVSLYFGTERRMINFLSYLRTHSAHAVVDAYRRLKAVADSRHEFWQLWMSEMNTSETMSGRILKELLAALGREDIENCTELFHMINGFKEKKKDIAMRLAEFIRGLDKTEQKKLRQSLALRHKVDPFATRQLVSNALAQDSDQNARRYFMDCNCL